MQTDTVMSNMSDKELKALLISQYIVILTSIAVIGLLLRRINGFKAAVKIPRIIVMKYLGYLETLEKNSPMLISSKSI